jgi:hypothetical protein
LISFSGPTPSLMRTFTTSWVKVLVCITFAGSHGSKSEGITSSPDPGIYPFDFARTSGNWERRRLREEEATRN